MERHKSRLQPTLRAEESPPLKAGDPSQALGDVRTRRPSEDRRAEESPTLKAGDPSQALGDVQALRLTKPCVTLAHQ